MRFLLLVVLAVASTLRGHCQALHNYDRRDAAALHKLAENWGHYWNTHNMDSMGTLLRPDVDFITVGGVWLRGKAAAVADHKQKHATIFKTSTWTTESVAITYVKPDVAIVHLSWGITGDFDPDGTPRLPRHGIFTWVATRQQQQWLLLAAHNVNIREPAGR